MQKTYKSWTNVGEDIELRLGVSICLDVVSIETLDLDTK